jgi:hypothetical protein
MNDQTDRLNYYLHRVQDYVDGTMSRRDAVEFYLLSRKEARLRQEAEAYKALHAALDQLPVEEPSASFDAAILKSVPLERYRSAPRKPARVLILGELREAIAARVFRRVRRPLLAGAMAYSLVLLVGHSFLARSVRHLALQLDTWLSDAVARSAEIPVLSSIVSGARGIYDAASSAVGFSSALFGEAGATVLLGLALGALVVGVAQSVRRRSNIQRSRV